MRSKKESHKRLLKISVIMSQTVKSYEYFRNSSKIFAI